MKLTKTYILEQFAAQRVGEKDALAMLMELTNLGTSSAEAVNSDIAIIGMACKLPDADNLEQFWSNLSAGKESIGAPPAERVPDIAVLADELFGQAKYSFAKIGYLRHVDRFDNAFFNISPAEARSMDPYQRLFLELAWEAIEHAGYSSAMMNGSRTGVFLGYCDNESQYQRYMEKVDASSLAGNIAAIIASRISHYLNLLGPSQLINTSCSSSLTALHQACLAIQNNDCDRALVGGVNLSLFPIEQDTDFGILSSGCRTKAFDDSADGTVTGEGLGIVYIKAYDQAVKDGDFIHAVIKGSAVNSDGRSSGITAPNAIAQSDTIRMAWKRANINPETISYIEAHGTGTRLGDPIEIEGLQNAFRFYTDKKQFCGIGSLKSNIGHTVAASGIAGIIKVVLMMQHRMIPPTLHVTKPNSLIPFIDSPVYINETLLPWDTCEWQPVRRAGVSAFGLSGTNVHIIVEETDSKERHNRSLEPTQAVLVLSAKTLASLREYVRRFAEYMPSTEYDLIDICATSTCGRDAHRYRIAIAAASKEELRTKVTQLTEQWPEEGWPSFTGKGIYLGNTDELCVSARMIKEDTKAEAMGRAFAGGSDIDWVAYYREVEWRRVPLPTYPFSKTRHWANHHTEQAAIGIEQATAIEIDETDPVREHADIHDIARSTFLFGESLLAHAGYKQPADMFDEEALFVANYFMQLFRGKGLFCEAKGHTLDEICAAVSLDTKQVRLFRYILSLLVETGYVTLNGSEYEISARAETADVEAYFEECLIRFPGNQGTWRLLKHCLSHYEEVLSGAINPLQVLYPDGTSHFFKSFEDESKSFGDLCGLMAVETIAQYIRSYSGKVRILEVGGGTGSLTQLLLPKIKDAQYEYTFTDIGNSQLIQARKQFEGEYPNLTYKLLDIGKQPSEQGFKHHSYDIIIAYNVIHATQDIRVSLLMLHTLLASKGILCSLELVKNRASTNLIWGLAEGWWAFKDVELRVHTPLIDHLRWEKALRDTNYEAVGSYPVERESRELAETMLVIGQSSYYPQAYQDWTYEIFWKQSELSPSSTRSSLRGNWLVFIDEYGIGDAVVQSLRSSGNSVYTISRGETFAQEQADWFVMNVTTNSDYMRLLHLLQEQDVNISGIVHLWSLDIPYQDNSYTPEQIESAQELGSYSLFHLAKALIALNVDHSIEIRIVTNRSQAVSIAEEVYPAQAPIVGLAKVIPQENPRLQCYVTDLAIGQLSATQLAQQVVQEIRFNYEDSLVAYRDKRIVPEMRRSDIDVIPDIVTPITLRAGAVYILVGGAGKLGLQIGKHIASKANVTLIIVNRTSLPPKEEWNDWITRPGCSLAEAAKMKAMLEIEGMGSTVAYYAADVSDPDQMETILHEVKHRYGPINGVIHSAMQQSFDPIAVKSFDNFRDGMKAKLAGTVVLDVLVETENLEFFIMFSSLASIWGGATGSDYVASNSFLDAYSAYRRYKGKHALAINWYAFEGITGPGFIGYMPIAGGMQSFDAILSKDVNQMVIGQFDLEILQQWRPSLKIRLSDDVFVGGEEHPNIHTPKGSAINRNDSSVVLTGKEDGSAYKADELAVGQIWSEVLGYETLSLDDDFFALGGDSLLAIGIVTRLAKHASAAVTINDIFINPTIRQLAAIIGSVSVEEQVLAIPIAQWAEYYPATSSQQRIYVLEQMQNGSVAYNIPTVLQLEGELDRERFEASFRLLIERHESFRTCFTINDGVLVQRIMDEADFTLEYEELSEASVIRDELNRAIRPFDLTKAPLLRSKLFRIEPNKHVLVLDMHHIISDGVSIGILINEFFHFYRAESLPALRIQYKDFSVWHNNRLKDGSFKKQEEYWCSVMSGQLPVLNLPTDFPRPLVKSYNGSVLTFEVGADLTDSIISFGQQRGTTLYMTLLTALNIMFAKYSGDEDIIIGSPVAGRNYVELEGIAGLFLNTLAMRNFPRRDSRVADFMEEIKQNTLAALSRSEYPFEMLVDRLSLQRDTSRNPLFDIMFILQNTGDAKEVLHEHDDKLKIHPYPFEQRSSQFDLTFDIIERNKRLIVDIEYSDELFRKETIEIMAGHFTAVLRALVEQADQKIGQISLLSVEERSLLIDQWNVNKTLHSREKTVVQLFEERAGLHPVLRAVQDGQRELTYGELNKRANRVAARLLENGARPDRFVALLMNRSVDMMIGLLGILKSGAALVPIDPNYPEERINYVLEDSGLSLAVADRSLTHKLSGMSAIIHVDEMDDGTESDTNPLIQSTSEHLAYMIYTSGSTGRPKGVMIEHRNLTAFKAGVEAAADFIYGGNWLALTTISFDIFILETILPLLNGSSVMIASEHDQINPHSIKQLILDHNVNMIQLTPSRLQLLLEDSSLPEAILRLQMIYVGGEALPLKLLQRLQAKTEAKIYNMYGPTETTIWSTVQNLTCANKVTIGRPIPNMQVYILDRNMQPVGINIIGDLYITGEAVARGYYGRNELTADRFIPCHFNPGQRMYRTGDLARWRPDGSIEYAGRDDFQVKVKGYRIELGEIEQSLCKHDSIQEAVVTLAGQETANPYLTAYYIGDYEIETKQLQLLLNKTLPDYMVPLAYTYMKNWPLTPNGKLDRLALPEPTRNIMSPVAAGATSTLSSIEQQLWDIWSELLQTDALGVYHNFFEMGSNSLAIVLVHEKLEALYPGTVRIVDLFAYPTISSLAQFIEDQLMGAEINFSEDDGDYWMYEMEGPILRLPREYKKQARLVKQERIMLSSHVEGERYARLQRAADHEKVEAIDILLALYVHLLSQIMGSEDIYLEQAVQGSYGPTIRPLRIELNRCSNFSELFLLIHQKRLFASLSQWNDSFWRKQKQENRQADDIIPLFSELSNYSRLNNMEHDLVHVVELMPDGIVFRTVFNGSCLHQRGVSSLLDDYEQLLMMLLDEYAT
ncbi:hybrid non-ribosomal peptide synthetase/type I polyketide synthase [Paenibacillus sp. P32E]|uniref:hybrid non-ribosomal peptide synthetase/type I polyketide synthase n=1 Tax=Paenibacillus sp. P32E TaxID=1349434 RepID=UPI00093F3160|nr:non-ribosomal peptide synthetase [Paenibacillus sp. P32E]OKP94761.1 non-ribosomal peptide synthetase [Paenibacillus sp. P32E]